ncbi:MAG: cysteine dioxygenase family protein [Casimicrobiaceae bacterium]
MRNVGMRGVLAESSLITLAERVAAGCAAPMDALADAVLAGLSASTADSELLSTEQKRGLPDAYARHLLYADPDGRFSIVSIVWRPGQCTTIHGHYTWCGYAVVAGSLHEQTYARMHELRGVRPSGCGDRSAGHACFAHAGIEEAHRLGNRSNADAVSVHVYGVDGPRVGTHVNRVVDAI